MRRFLIFYLPDGLKRAVDEAEIQEFWELQGPHLDGGVTCIKTRDGCYFKVREPFADVQAMMARAPQKDPS